MTDRYAPVYENLDVLQAEINVLQANVNNARAVVERLERAEDETLVGIEELSRITNVPVNTIRSRVNERTIRHYKVGGNLRFNVREILEDSRR